MLTATRSDDVRIQNRRRVLAAVRRSGIASRTEIGRVTGLSAATVSAITSDFLDEGVLLPPVSKDLAVTGRGRPKIALVINPKAALVCALYFHLNMVSAALIDFSGVIVGEYSCEFSMHDISESEIRSVLEKCTDGVLARAQCKPQQLRRIAVGFQGVTDVDGSMVLWTPICRQRNIPIKTWLEARYGVPVRVANDCDMIAQALNWRDPHRFGENFGAVLLAHGVGMGLYLRQSIINGTRSSGVEFGHMNYVPGGALCRCGNRGCIEAYAGDYAISRRAKGEPQDAVPSGLLDAPDLGMIAQAARNDDAEALAAIEAAGAAIGTGLANLYALVDPFPVVLVGRGAIVFDLMENSIRKALDMAPGEYRSRDVEIECYEDERPLVREGCAISALLEQDIEMASRRAYAGVLS